MVTPQTAVDEPVTTPLPETAGTVETFSWAKHWYAVCAAHELDPTRPHAFGLLGKNLVIWKGSNTGRWNCLEDRCPHRAAPLSEGKIWPDGNLCCSYHGWRFDGSGSCKAIPQADSAEQEARAAASPRACAVAYPIQERQGMLFVWGEGGQAAFKEAEQQEPPLCTLTRDAEAQGKEVKELMKHYTRDLPYDYAALVENFLDPAHVPWAHHGVMGSRDDVQFGQFRLHKAGELSASYEESGLVKHTTITYHPPGVLIYELEGQTGDKSNMMFWVTPVAPGRSRVNLHLATAADLPPLFKLLGLVPAWLDHITMRSTVFDGDNVFLAGQDRNLAQHAQHEGATWRDLFYMPTATDTLVAALRKWLDEKGGGGPFGSLRDSSSPASKAAAAAAAAVAQPGREARRHMLDRYSQHTVHCASCRSALQTITVLRNVFAGAAVLAWAACLFPLLLVASSLAGPGHTAAAAAMADTQPALGLAPVLPAAALTAVAALLTKVQARFIFVGYDHAHRRAGAPQRAQVARWVAPSSTSAELIAEGPHIAPNPKPAGEPANFSWSKHWYAVCAAHDVDPTRPLLLTLLGKNLVIWKDSSTGRWSCLEDRCPHRAAPLSEGKIWPDGSLCCSYHGWRFDCQGLCKAIQADSTEQEAKAAAAPRACAVAYPVQERQGMLFVWGEGGQAAFEEARRWEPPLCQLTLETEAEGREVMHVMRHYTRDLPYSYVALVENLVDPAHLPWAHHGVIGNRDQVAYGKSGMRRAGQLSAVHDHFDPFVSLENAVAIVNWHRCKAGFGGMQQGANWGACLASLGR
ncbi:hypothetical protein N2152v2_010607 [Parachlorella kessleri]